VTVYANVADVVIEVDVQSVVYAMALPHEPSPGTRNTV